MPSSLTSGGHYLEKHPAYNMDDLSANIVSNFNNAKLKNNIPFKPKDSSIVVKNE